MMRATHGGVLAASLAFVAFLAVPSYALAEGAQTDPIQEMRKEIDDLRAQIRALRDEIAALKTAAGSPGSAASLPDSFEPSPPEPAPAPTPSPAPSATSSGARPSNLFNPAISAVFQGIGRSSVNANRDEDGFSLSEVEIGLQAVVDPYARVDLFLTYTAEGEAAVEEGVVTSTSMPGGLQLKGGRYKSAFGKWNTFHAHQYFTVDRPDVFNAFFGEESLTADGVSLSWLLPGTGSVWVESVTEIGSTPNDVFFNARRRDYLALQHIRSVFNLTDNATLGVGLSAAAGKAGPSQELQQSIDDAGLSSTVVPSGRLASNVFGADFTWKWKPVQFNVYRSATWQTEILAGRREVESLDPAGFLDKNLVRSLGGYTYGEYQFAKRWRAGLRYDFTEMPDDADARQRAVAAVLRLQPTEFMEFRIQFKHTSRNELAAALYDDRRTDNEVYVEWIPVIGAHAAHKY